jgi:hypothetical protein
VAKRIFTVFTDRSRSQFYQRCKRARWHEYESGPAGIGIVPRKKSLHLCVGLAVHSGLATLLRGAMFHQRATPDLLRALENEAVKDALEELGPLLAAGVEVDVQELPEPKETRDGSGTVQIPDLGAGSLHSSGSGSGRSSDANSSGQVDSPIVIDFGGEVDFSDPTYDKAIGEAMDLSEISPDEVHAAAERAEQQASGVDEYLKKELAALVEGMVRAYARRRLKPLISEFEIFEIEREGSWKLGEHNPSGRHAFDGPTCSYCGCWMDEAEDETGEWKECPAAFELFWMSRHDGLLLERQTSFLYLLSFKTTGAWDRRKKADAEVDMQGLSEAVDVEKRLGEAWELLHVQTDPVTLGAAEMIPAAVAQVNRLRDKKIAELCSPRIAQWLSSQPSPPKILGVRYEYILKGARREDKTESAGDGNGGSGSARRWVQDSPLIRAWRQDGITLEDRRWAATYKWWGELGRAGPAHTLPYRSWKKSAVWESMSIREWVDMLDRGEEVQPEARDEEGARVDVLAEQFVPPVVVYRAEDDMRDMLEQLEAQEVRVALDVEEVRRAQARGEGEYRSALNRLFPQTRSACSYPGLCEFRPVCYGGEDIRRDPLTNSDLYVIRSANHPIEMTVTE